MQLATWISFIIYDIISSFTPGPNNILILNSTSRYGFKKSSHLLFGICFGLFSVMLTDGIICTALSSIIPIIINIMKYLGAAYVLWLAWHMAKVSSPITNSNVKQYSFLQGFLLQFVNIKIILYGVTAITNFVLPHVHSLIGISGMIIVITLIGNAGTWTWALAGIALSSFLQKHWKVANSIMILLLVYCAIDMIFS